MEPPKPCGPPSRRHALPRVPILYDSLPSSRNATSELVVRDKLLLTVLLAVMPLVGLLLTVIAQPSAFVGDSALPASRRSCPSPMPTRSPVRRKSC